VWRATVRESFLKRLGLGALTATKLINQLFKKGFISFAVWQSESLLHLGGQPGAEKCDCATCHKRQNHRSSCSSELLYHSVNLANMKTTVHCRRRLDVAPLVSTMATLVQTRSKIPVDTWITAKILQKIKRLIATGTVAPGGKLLPELIGYPC